MRLMLTLVDDDFGTLGWPKGGALKFGQFLFHFSAIQKVGLMQISNYWDGPGRPGRSSGYATAHLLDLVHLLIFDCCNPEILDH